MAAGDEILIVDSTAAHRDGMRKLFEDMGYVVSSVATGDEARDLGVRKFFAAVAIDLDVDRPGAGLDVVRFFRERSKPTGVVLLTGRRSFESAVEAMRLGVVDIVVKAPGEVERLKAAIGAASERHRATSGDKGLLRDALSVLDESFRVMLDMARVVYRDVSMASGSGTRPRVLVVDSDPAFLKELAGAVAGKAWEIAAEMSGGSALDKASSQTFDIVATRDDLPDLRGSMVLKSIQASRAEAIGLVYGRPGGEGRIERFESGVSKDVERPFRGVEHLVKRIEQAADELGATQRDRRVIQHFRREKADFLRRWADLKQRLDRVAD